MANIKGTDVISLKKLFREYGEEKHNHFIQNLDTESQQFYHKILATTWTPIHSQAKIYEVAGKTLFPKHERPVFELHKELAQRSYSGIYKIFLSIPKITFIIKRCVSVWRSYYDKGTACVEDVTNTSAKFIVKDFPDLPHAMREATNAHITVLCEAAGAKNINVERIDNDPHEWKWNISWN